MFITTYYRRNINFNDIISRHWPNLREVQCHEEYAREETYGFMHKTSFLKIYIGLSQNSTIQFSKSRACNRPHICKYSDEISQTGIITNLHNNKTYNTMKYGKCQDNLICVLECNIHNIQYIGQTKKIKDKFQGHILTLNTCPTQQSQDTYPRNISRPSSI